MVERTLGMNKKGTLVAGTTLLDPATLDQLPPILLKHETPAIKKKVVQFYLSIAEIFERWVARRDSPHTQRAYRQDVMALVTFLGMTWPNDATALLTISVGDIHAWRDQLCGFAVSEEYGCHLRPFQWSGCAEKKCVADGIQS